MGARQSKRSVDITTTPKKCEGEANAEGEGKLEKIGDVDVKVTNGDIHKQIEDTEKTENGTEESEKEEVKENGISESEDSKTPDKETPAAGDQLNESAVAEKPQENGEEKVEETPDTKKCKEKTKKKKWSFRSISFSKKDKSKPSKDAEKNGDVKEVAEETAEENATTPSAETPKTEEPKAQESAAEPMTNGNATAEELAKPIEETPKPAEEPAKPVEEPKVSEPAKEIPVESAPSPVKEEEKAPKEEPVPQAEQPKADEPKPVETPAVVEETKEVRNEEVPPPLPTSNPPSSVTVFAESTKADALPLGQVPQDPQSPMTVPLVETLPEQLMVRESVVETLPPAASSPVVENVPETLPVVESTVLSLSSDSAVKESVLSTTVSVTSTTEQQVSVSLVSEENKVPSEVPADLPPPELETSATESEKASKPESESAAAAMLEVLVNPPVIPSPVAPKESPVAESASTEVPPEQITESECQLSNVIAEKESDVTESLPPPPLEETVVPESSEESQPDSLPAPPESLETSDKVVQNLPDSLLPPEAVASSPTEELPPPTKDIATLEASLPEPVSLSSEPVANADSLPDISTESLPSLPEPVSDNIPEPLSLPPVDLVPNPIVTDVLPESSSADLASPVSENSVPVKEIPLTNGTTNGLSSPVDDDVSVHPKDGPLKQVPPAVAENEVRQECGDAKTEVVAESTPTAVEE